MLQIQNQIQIRNQIQIQIRNRHSGGLGVLLESGSTRKRNFPAWKNRVNPAFRLNLGLHAPAFSQKTGQLAHVPHSAGFPSVG